MVVEAVGGVGRLGPEWDKLFATGPGVQSGRAWFAATEAAALPAGTAPCWLAVREAGRPVALLPLRVTGPEVASLTTPYTVLFQPMLAVGADAERVGLALGRFVRRWPLVRLEALDAEWLAGSALLAGLRRAGLIPIRYDHFGNWSEDVPGLGWSDYLARRPGALRETIRRRGAAAAKDASIRFEIVRGPEGVERGLAAYEAVYATSWKEKEPFPRFNAVLLPALAEGGALRLAVMWRGDTPLAAQYWTVAKGVATVLKLAHDEAGRALSPGTLLTAHVIRRLLDEEQVAALDFGRGDDAYKKDWVSVRRQRIGVLLANRCGRLGCGNWPGTAPDDCGVRSGVPARADRGGRDAHLAGID